MSDALVGVNATFLGAWTDLLRPVRSYPDSRLASIFKDTSVPSRNESLATNVLTDYASDDPSLLADLLMAADPKAYQRLFPLVQEQRARNVRPCFKRKSKRRRIPRQTAGAGQGRTCRAPGPVRRWPLFSMGKPRRSSRCWFTAPTPGCGASSSTG